MRIPNVNLKSSAYPQIRGGSRRSYYYRRRNTNHRSMTNARFACWCFGANVTRTTSVQPLEGEDSNLPRYCTVGSTYRYRYVSFDSKLQGDRSCTVWKYVRRITYLHRRRHLVHHSSPAVSLVGPVEESYQLGGWFHGWMVGRINRSSALLVYLFSLRFIQKDFLLMYY
jgi:hypothetical protein